MARFKLLRSKRHLIFSIASVFAWIVPTLSRSLKFLKIFQDETLERGPEPKGLVQEEMLSLIPPIVFDSPKLFHNFGDVLLQPEVENQHGDVVVATFVSTDF